MKKLLLCGLVILASSCADFKQTMDAQMKSINAALNTKSTDTQAATAAKKAGTLTNEQCKTSVGKTKSHFEEILGFKLNETNSSGFNSMSETYNLRISDRKDRLGGNYAICILSIDPQTSKVTLFSMVN